MYALTPRGGATNSYAEEKGGRPAQKPNSSAASNANIKSYSTDSTYSRGGAHVRSPKRSQLHNQPQSQNLFDKYAAEEVDDDDLITDKYFESQLNQKQQQISPIESSGKNLRHPVKSLRRNPEIESPVPTQQNNNAPSMDTVVEDMAIRVVVRKRPLSKGEISRGEKDVMEVNLSFFLTNNTSVFLNSLLCIAKVLRGGTVLLHEPKTKVDLTKVVETQSFVFDDAFEAHETNETIYDRTIKQLVNFVFDGGKASCFAYGQTGNSNKSSLPLILICTIYVNSHCREWKNLFYDGK